LLRAFVDREQRDPPGGGGACPERKGLDGAPADGGSSALSDGRRIELTTDVLRTVGYDRLPGVTDSPAAGPGRILPFPRTAAASTLLLV
jgi:hypothetical protein